MILYSIREYSSVVEQLTLNQPVVGSIPSTPLGRAQLLVRWLRLLTERIFPILVGSNPISSEINIYTTKNIKYIKTYTNINIYI